MFTFAPTQGGFFWNPVLQWTTNPGPNPGQIQGYLNLITSEHYAKPNFMTTVGGVIQAFADTTYTESVMWSAFDLDNAAGAQLDILGLWIGVSRILAVPITGVFFAWDTAGVGWDQGIWLGPGVPSNQLVSLPDAQYRTLLKAKIANNQWDGTIPGAYAIYAVLFAGTSFGINIQDNQDMTMTITVTGPPLDALTKAIVTGGYLDLKPAGVRATYITP